MAGKTLAELIVASQAGTRRIHVEQLHVWQEDDEPLLLVDVRESEEYAAGHLPGALSIPRGLLEPAADLEYANRDPQLSQARGQRVVLYCDSPTGARACFSANTLQEMGFRWVYYLAGGIGMWVAEGFSLETGLMAGLCYRRQGRQAPG